MEVLRRSWRSTRPTAIIREGILMETALWRVSRDGDPETHQGLHLLMETRTISVRRSCPLCLEPLVALVADPAGRRLPRRSEG